MNALLDLSSADLNKFCRQNGIRSLALFGSYLHGEARPESDVDLLVEFDPQRRVGLFDIARMEIELTDLIGQKVDLRTANELSRYFRNEVVSEAKVIYG